MPTNSKAREEDVKYVFEVKEPSKIIAVDGTIYVGTLNNESF